MRSEDLKISIVISVYNIEKYIEDCIKSVLRQEYKEWECILVDDGSKDNSGNICDTYSKKYENIFVIHQKNRGPSGARNTGLRNCSGEYVYFIDGDDLISEETLHNFSLLIDKSKPDMILGHMNSFKENEVLKPYGNIVQDKWIKDKTGKEGFILIYEKNGIVFMGVRGLYKKDFLVNNNLFFDEQCTYSEDQEWTVRCFNAAKTIRSNENRDYYYRAGRTGSLMNTVSCKKIEHILLIYDNWYKDILKFPEDDFYRCLYKMMIERYWSLFFQYSTLFDKKEFNRFCFLMDKRKYYVFYKPKDVKFSKKIWIIRLFKAKYICKITKFWKKVHNEY